MQLDDPQASEFASWRSYINFAKKVRRERRFVWDSEVNAFLETVRATIQDRDSNIPKGIILYRAQRGIQYREDEKGVDISAFEATRMKPLNDRAREGRANPPGIPMLYLASDERTAISEVRPWIGSEVSVAQIRIVRELNAINLSFGHGLSVAKYLDFDELIGKKQPSRETKEKAVWIDIDNAFSHPITLSDDTADYAPTQILAELFRDNGYDALVYRSQFGEEGYNVALFDLDDGKIINAAPYRVSEMKLEFEEIGTRWFATKEYETVVLAGC